MTMMMIYSTDFRYVSTVLSLDPSCETLSHEFLSSVHFSVDIM